MGIFGKLFGKKEEYPALDSSTLASTRLQHFKEQLEPFVQKINDNIELVPAENTIYVYIGKPPGMFGMAWFEDGKEVNFKTLMKNKGLTQRKVQHISMKLGEAYENSKGTSRFSVDIAGKTVTVTPSDALAAEIQQIIQEGSA